MFFSQTWCSMKFCELTIDVSSRIELLLNSTLPLASACHITWSISQAEPQVYCNLHAKKQTNQWHTSHLIDIQQIWYPC